MSTHPPEQNPAAATEPPPTDSAVEFLAALTPEGSGARRRAFSALLGALVREESTR